MSPWECMVLVGMAGALGGILNAFFSDNGFVLPRYEAGVLCPGFISNVLVGALSAITSWGLYGSGAGVELAKTAASGAPRAEISLTIGALAGGLIVGVGGARWLTNEVDKRLLKEGVKLAGQKHLSRADCEDAVNSSPRETIARLRAA